jgi:hypothetical protein
MYENKELGLVVAENEEEVFWTEIKSNTEEDIKKLEKLLKFQREILNLAKSHLSNECKS